MKLRARIALIIALVLAVLTPAITAFADDPAPAEDPPVAIENTANGPNWQDFIGKSFAVKEGTIFHELALTELSASDVLLFDDYPSVYEAVLAGKTDAALRGYVFARVARLEPRYAAVEVIKLPDDGWSLPVAAISMDQALIDDFNALIAELKSSGIYDEMVARWIDDFDPLAMPVMPDIPLTGEQGTYVVAVSSDYVPMSFIGDDGRNAGFDIELATRFAAAQGKNIEFQDVPFSSLLPNVVSHRADFAVSDIVITPERAEQVLFTDPYYMDGSALLFRQNDATRSSSDLSDGASDSDSGGFLNWIRLGVQRNLIQGNRWHMIVNGLGVTLLIALSAQVFGTILGCLLCYVLLRKNRFAKTFGKTICSLVSGTPELVLLMLLYYVVFGRSAISNVIVAIIAFTIITAVIVAETLKSAIETVDETEIEAAESLGFSPLRTFTTVTLPQAVHQALPAYLSDFVELIKGTAVVGFIAIMDLTRAGDVIRSNTYDAYFPIVLVTIIYLIVTSLLVFAFRKVVRRINTGAF